MARIQFYKLSYQSDENKNQLHLLVCIIPTEYVVYYTNYFILEYDIIIPRLVQRYTTIISY
jgi:hypothetical protein